MIAPRFSIQSSSVRRLGPSAGGFAPGEGGPPCFSPGAVIFTNDGDDLADLPPMARVAISRFMDCAIPCEAEKGREGMPLGAFPLPQERGATSSTSERACVEAGEGGPPAILPLPLGPP